jgi:hypothetical protein
MAANEYAYIAATKTPEQKAKNELYKKQEDINFMNNFFDAFFDRVKNPSNGILPKKAKNLTNKSLTNLGFNKDQLLVIQKAKDMKALLLEDSVIDNHDKMVVSMKEFKRMGKSAFPKDGKDMFARVARLLHDNKDKKGHTLVRPSPMWWYSNSTGGKRRTHKRSTKKRSTKKRRTSRRN